MAQIFSPSTNSLSKVSIVAGAIVAGTGTAALTTFNRWPWVSNVEVAVEQTVPFSHKHHVAGLGIDCRFCHTSVEESATAGIPPVKTCMGCHSVVWKDAPILEPIRESYRSDVPLQWNKVHDLPDFVYFNHSIHVKKGVGCESCHGRVDQMPLMWKVNSLNMEWCLACHRHPENFLRPRDQITTMGWSPDNPDWPLAATQSTDAAEHGAVVHEAPRKASQAELGQRLLHENKVQSLTHCSTCHR
jgi:hypothetical protein